MKKNIVILLFFTIFFRSVASLCAKKAGLYSIDSNLIFIIFNYWYLLQVFFLGLQFFIWMNVLRNLDLSIAYSSMSAVVILNYLIGIFIFNEQFIPKQLLGIIIIIIGIYILFKKEDK